MREAAWLNKVKFYTNADGILSGREGINVMGAGWIHFLIKCIDLQWAIMIVVRYSDEDTLQAAIKQGKLLREMFTTVD
jgi:hypothetical protein